jgi:hypothetical protein
MISNVAQSLNHRDPRNGGKNSIVQNNERQYDEMEVNTILEWDDTAKNDRNESEMIPLPMHSVTFGLRMSVSPLDWQIDVSSPL